MRIRRGGGELGLAFVRVGVDRLESSLKPLRGGGGVHGRRRGNAGRVGEWGSARHGGRLGGIESFGDGVRRLWE